MTTGLDKNDISRANTQPLIIKTLDGDHDPVTITVRVLDIRRNPVSGNPDIILGAARDMNEHDFKSPTKPKRFEEERQTDCIVLQIANTHVDEYDEDGKNRELRNVGLVQFR